MTLSQTRFWIQALTLAAVLVLVTGKARAEPAVTGVSGVYEVMVGVPDLDVALRHFGDFGFREISRARIGAGKALALYGHASELTSVRMQNAQSSAHGLVRLLAWEEAAGPGVGYAPPETIGQRLAVMRTQDIYRLYDIFSDARSKGQAWLVTEPIYDDLYALTDGEPDLYNRRVGVRENAAYGSWFNHVFFQRYGYQIPGYGTIDAAAPLRTSEFTHHDFIVRGPLAQTTAHYESVLGFRAEAENVSLDGDWLHGPQRVFQMRPGASHHYRGFVSPNNVCGKLKFFAPRFPPGDASDLLVPGALGITVHSVTTPKLAFVHQLAVEHSLAPSAIGNNEFDERSFFFTGPDGASWQIIDQGPKPRGVAETQRRFETTVH